MIIRTVGEWDYSQVDDRLLAHPGCIVDLGCATWDFVKPFIGKKRIVGADPNEKPVDGVEMYQGVVGATTGTVSITDDGQNSSAAVLKGTTKTVASLNWRDFCATFKIESISLLKINIEGSEYPLLLSMDEDDFKVIDQIAVSFHEFLWPARKKSTRACLAYLQSLGYGVRRTADWGWFLALRDWSPTEPA